MRKSVQFGMAALCFALTLASVTDTVAIRYGGIVFRINAGFCYRHSKRGSCNGEECGALSGKLVLERQG